MKPLRKHTTTTTRRPLGRLVATVSFLGLLLAAGAHLPARAQEHAAPAGTAASSPASAGIPSSAGAQTPGTGTTQEGVRTPAPTLGEPNSPDRPAGEAHTGEHPAAGHAAEGHGAEGEKKEPEEEVSIHLPTWIAGALENFWYHGPVTVSASGVVGAKPEELKGKTLEMEWENHHFHGHPKPVYQIAPVVTDGGRLTEALPGQHLVPAKLDGREIQLINPEFTFKNAGMLPEALAISLLTALTMIVVALLLCRNLTRVPNRRQTFLELIYGYFDNFVHELIGPTYKRYVPLVGATYLYILIMNLAGLIPGWMSPTANINVAAGLSLVVIVFVQVEGLRVNGLKGYLMHFVGDPWWLGGLNFPLHVVGEVARILSLSVRLFGNIFGEDVVIVILIGLAVKFTHGFIPAQAPMYFLAMFTSVVQAMVFSILTCVYIALMTVHEDHGHADHGHDGHGHDAAAPAHAH